MTDGQHEGQQPHRVVIVGGGFGGLNVTRALARAEDVHVTLIDRTNHHLFQPLLYQVAAGILPPGLIAPALRGVISTQRNARAVLADVHDLDLDARVVRAAGPDGRAVGAAPLRRARCRCRHRVSRRSKRAYY